jgi:hypothetical protein
MTAICYCGQTIPTFVNLKYVETYDQRSVDRVNVKSWGFVRDHCMARMAMIICRTVPGKM